MKTNTAKANAGTVALAADRPVLNETLLVGLDLGTNTACLMASPQGENDSMVRELIPTVVGYANPDVLNVTLQGQVIHEDSVGPTTYINPILITEIVKPA